MKGELKGLADVTRNLNKEIMAIKGRSMEGLIQAAIIIRRDMDKTEPKIPVDTGNLRQSWFTSPIRKGFNFGLLIGFSANYAVFVHELVDKSGKKVNWNRPGSGPKFFESSLWRNADLVLDTIRLHAQIKS